MSEKMREPIPRLELAELEQGQVVVITTGIGNNAWQYSFVVEQPGRWPTGKLSARKPSGEITKSWDFCLQGSGKWTTKEQNPVQTQDKAFTSHFDSLAVGGFMVGTDAGARPQDRYVFDKAGQEITQIEVRQMESAG